jgi:hypothetical protein
VWTIPRRLSFFYFSRLRSMQVCSEMQTFKIEATDKSIAPSKHYSRKSILALSVFALGLNATAAVYTLSPSDFVFPNVSGLVAELFPHQAAPAPIPETVVAALKDIQSTQQQQAGALQENASLLQLNTVLLKQNTALRYQDETIFDSLRKSITDEQVDVKKISAQIADEHVDVRKISAEIADEHVDVRKISAEIADEHVDVKKMSTQISTLIAKVDSLQNAIKTEITSSIPKGRARARLSGAARKRLVRQAKPVGPISVGGAPLTKIPGPMQSPEG